MGDDLIRVAVATAVIVPIAAVVAEIAWRIGGLIFSRRPSSGSGAKE